MRQEIIDKINERYPINESSARIPVYQYNEVQLLQRQAASYGYSLAERKSILPDNLLSFDDWYNRTSDNSTYEGNVFLSNFQKMGYRWVAEEYAKYCCSQSDLWINAKHDLPEVDSTIYVLFKDGTQDVCKYIEFVNNREFICNAVTVTEQVTHWRYTLPTPKK